MKHKHYCGWPRRGALVVLGSESLELTFATNSVGGLQNVPLRPSLTGSKVGGLTGQTGPPSQHNLPFRGGALKGKVLLSDPTHIPLKDYLCCRGA